ncbi:MAG: tetratricopeptide repeat protein [Deltaproteobacteria bacterium]|nr:tetratricopeptide repeat protein [Deltaproteobacteria bacterium]
MIFGPYEISCPFNRILGDGKMMENAKHLPITIDLNQFRLLIDLKNRIKLTLHFNSPSRKFYLSLIAFVVNEMKRLGKITSIPLEGHHDLLVLLNETIGGAAGSSEKENLLPRIYRKWQQALPNLEEAPLFKVVGRKKEFEEGVDKIYPFTEAEKDSWANLFEYIGSEEHVRLRFSIDRIGARLDDVVIIYEVYQNAEAWERFISNLRQKEEEKPKPADFVPKEPEAPVPPTTKWKTALRGQWRWVTLLALIIAVIVGVSLATWRAYFYASPDRVASIERMAFPLPDKPSIAVLPFINMSGDPKEDYFSDGLTEQIINSLSKFPRLFVIARNSTFVYKGKPVKIQKVAEDLGVRYVLEGSVQKSGDRVRITTQLIDAITGRHVWSEHYDRELKDLFALQDEITIKIMNGMSIELTEGEQARRWTKAGTTNLKALEKNYQALAFFMRNTKEDHDTARQLYEEAIALDPKFVWPYVHLGYTYFMEARYGWSEAPAKSYQMAFELAQKALALDDSDDRVHTLLSFLYLVKREYDKSLSEAKRAVALNPNGADAYFGLAAIVGVSGRWEESVLYGEKSIRLSPFPGVSHYWVLGRAYFMTGQYDESIAIWKKVLKISPDFLIAHLFLAACYSSMGRDAEAAAAAREVLRINPKFNIESHAKTLPYKDKADIEREVAALKKAGLK